MTNVEPVTSGSGDPGIRLDAVCVVDDVELDLFGETAEVLLVLPPFALTVRREDIIERELRAAPSPRDVDGTARVSIVLRSGFRCLSITRMERLPDIGSEAMVPFALRTRPTLAAASTASPAPGSK